VLCAIWSAPQDAVRQSPYALEAIPALLQLGVPPMFMQTWQTTSLPHKIQHDTSSYALEVIPALL
jgi:hypothetical protein